MGWLPIVIIFESIFPTLVHPFYSRVTYGLGGPITSTVRGVEIRLSPESICRIFYIPSIGLRVYSPRFGPLCRVLTLERLFRGCVALQTPRGWANHRHIDWLWPTESLITWSAPCFCHEEDTKMRSRILRHSSYTWFWREDRFTWGIWWWFTWYHAVRARPEYSPMIDSLLEFSRMSGLI